MKLKTGGWDKEPCVECGIEETLRPGTTLPWICDVCQRDLESYEQGYKAGYAAGLEEALNTFKEKLELLKNGRKKEG